MNKLLLLFSVFILFASLSAAPVGVSGFKGVYSEFCVTFETEGKSKTILVEKTDFTFSEMPQYEEMTITVLKGTHDDKLLKLISSKENIPENKIRITDKYYAEMYAIQNNNRWFYRRMVDGKLVFKEFTPPAWYVPGGI